MIRADYPNRWPSLLDELFPIISSTSQEQTLSGLAIFHELVSWQGGVNSDESKELIHGKFFPILLDLLQKHLSLAAEAVPQAMAIVKSIVKCYHAAIQYRFSSHLLLGGAFSAWCTAITQVITSKPPPSILQLSREEAEAHLYWKMKKWSLRVHNKLFQRYGCSKLDSFNNPDHPAFAKFYMDHVALPVLNVYLQQIELSISGANPVPERVFCLLCDFLESSIRHKRTWAALEPHALNVLAHFCFPRVCFSEEDQEMWEEEPEEYLKKRYDPFEELYSATSSCVSYTLDLMKCRKKTMFIPILQFINLILSAPEGESPQKKDGAFFLLGSIARVLLASDLKSQIESVLSSFVLPELANQQHGFLRMRACWTLEQFDEVELGATTAINALHGVLRCLGDRELPVRVAASGALGSLIGNENVQQALPPLLSQVMEALLSLANEFQSDSIAFVLERFVEMFAEHLTPYAVQLCVQLRDTVARHLEGYTNFLEADVEDDAFGQGADRMMAVAGMFKAIETLVESLSKTAEMAASLEEVILPLLALVFERSIIDVYEETFELIDSITFARKSISPGLWALLPYLHRTFTEVGSDYIQDMHTCLDNYISYGTGLLFSPADQGKSLALLLDIIRTTMTDELFNEYDRVYGCKLMESLLLNGRGHIDGLIPTFISFVLPVIAPREPNESEPTLSVLVAHLEVVLNALYYDAARTLVALEEAHATTAFFTLWFQTAPKFTRVHDKRLIIVATLAILSLPQERLPPVLVAHYAQILPVLLFAIQTLPKALEERKRLQEEGNETDDSDWDSEGNYDSDGDCAGGSDYDEIHDEDDNGDASTAEALAERANHGDNDEDGEGLGDYDWEEDALEEELFFETPLDNMDMSVLVQQSLRGLAHQQQPTFAALTSHLNQEQATFLKSLLN